MRISLALLFAVVLQLSAEDGYAQRTRVAISMNNVSVEQVLNKIEETSDYVFLYNDKTIQKNRIVSVRNNSGKILDILDEVFKGTNITYTVVDKQIILSTNKLNVTEQDPTIQVKGTVKDTKGEPLIGVNVKVKGTTTGAITDFDGNFQIQAKKGAVLEISYIGYASQEVKVTDNKSLSIVMTEDAKVLNEVVVTALGIKRETKSLTYNVQQIGGDEVAKAKDMNVMSSLAGKVAGVNINASSSGIGGGARVVMRGTKSISGNNNALYVVDGVPLANISGEQPDDQYTGAGQSGDGLANFNADDIESISVLSGSAAAALYGSAAANGVVLITTKRGNSGKARIDYDYQFSMQQVERKIKLLDAYQYRDLVIEARNNSYRDKAEAAGKSWNPLDDNAIRASKGFNLNEVGISDLFFDFTTGKPVDPTYNTDWQDAIYGNAPMHRHNLSVTGGQDFLKYRFSLGYLDQDGIIAPSGHKRLNVRANVDAEVTKRLKVGVNFSFVDVSERQVQADGRYINDGVVQSALLMFPQFPVYNSDGTYAVGNQIAMKADGYQMVENPVALAHEIDIRNKSSRMNFNANITYDILKQLQFKANLGTQYYTSRYNYYRPRTVGQDGDMPNSDAVQARVKARDITNRDIDRLGEFTLNYNGEFGKHRLNALVGYTLQKKTYDRVAVEATGFPDDRIHEVTAHGPNASDIGLYSSDTRKAAWTMMSYLARVNYSFDNRYVVTGTVRTDGSSRFGKENRWGWFPSISLGWTISNEKFYQDLLGNNSSLKLRASWGLSGNNNIGNYEHTATMSQGGYVYGNTVETAYWQGTFKDAAIGWEKTSQYNVGFDLGLFNGRVNLIGNYYNSLSYDLLYDQPISSISGSSSVKTNLKNAKVRNSGVDFQIDGRILTGDFKWNVSANISVNRNKVVDLGGINDLYLVSERNVVSHVTRSGLPIGSFYGYIADGIISEKDYTNIMIDKSNLVNGKFPDGYQLIGPAVPNYNNIHPGDVKWRDVDKNGLITENDREILGNAYPDFTYGISTDFSYKNFDLRATFTGSQGAEVINFQKYYLYNMEGSGNQLASVLNRWHSDENPGSGGVFRAARSSTPNTSQRLSSYMVDDASYFRCANITLGYNFPVKWMQKVSVQALRLYVSVDNLFTLTDYEGYNPEVDYKGDNLLPGFDWGVYPLARTYSIGAKITF